MDIKKMDWYRKHKIALRLLLVMILELCSPLADTFVYASPVGPNLNTPNPTYVQGNNDGSSSSTRYGTTAYNIPVVDKNGVTHWIDIPANPTTVRENGKAITTHTLDLELFKEKVKDIDFTWEQFLGDDGMYHLPSDNTMTVYHGDGREETVTTVGQMKAAADWSSATDERLESDDPDVNPMKSDFALPPDAIPITEAPPNTPVPSVTEGPQATKAPASVTPIPTNAPTDIPVSEAPPPTPEPTATPKPSISPTPYPTPAPVTYTYDNLYEYHKYYSSTNGHSVSDITVNRKIADDTSANTASLADAIAAVGTRTAYSVGTDSSGNQWYYIAKQVEVPNGYGGTTYEYYAYSVHPKTYGGHSVDSSAVRFISNLVFPEQIGSYKVKSIGGSGAYYYGEPASAVSGTVSSNLGSYSGDYSWKDGTSTWEFSYLLGSVGSGTIKSKGFGTTVEYNYNTYIYNNTYSTNYYVYNTTLTSITIPANCETIEDYAFHNCQALINIKGGANLKTIGTHAFSVAEVPELKRSYKYVPNYWAYNYSITEKIYSYDDSYSMQYAGDYPATMTKFQDYVTIADYMAFPDPTVAPYTFSTLVTIGESAFEGRYHLDEVKLANTVETVHKNAFKGCTLDRITVPSEKTSIKGGYDTLGTKGPDVNFLTEIVTPSTSPAYPRMYGELYDAYYRVFQDAYIYYYPNGGTPNTVYTELAEIEYKEASFGDTYFDLGNSCILWLGDDGYVYYACVDDANVLRGNVVAALRSLRFVSMEKKASLGGYYEAVTADGRYCYISATTVSVKGQKYESVYQGSDRGWQDVLVEYHRYYEPSVSYFYMPGYIRCIEMANITFPAYNENYGALYKGPGQGTAYGIKAVSEDGRFHWSYNGTWVSEPAWPSGVTVVQTILNRSSVPQFGFLYNHRESNEAYSSGYPYSYYEYASVYHHGVILCSDGSVYTKIDVNSAWTKMEGTYDAISLGTSATGSYGTGSSSSYVRERDSLYLNQDYLYEKLNITTYRRYQIKYKSTWNSTTLKSDYILYADRSTYTDVDASGIEFGEPLPVAAASVAEENMETAAAMGTRATNTVAFAETYLYTSPNGSDSDIYYSVERHAVYIYQDSSTKAMTMRHYHESDNNANDSDPSDTSYSDYAAGTGTFLAARFQTTGLNGMGGSLKKRFIYYFGSDGALYCTYGENYGTSTKKVSDFEFVKYYLLSPTIAPMGGERWYTSQGQKHGINTSSSVTNTTSSGDYINLICLDADGHLWGGVLGYGSATFTQMSDKVFTDILYKEITEQGEYASGNTTGGDYMESTYARLYALDTNKDLYKYDRIMKEVYNDKESGESRTQVDGNWVVTATYNASVLSTTYYGYDTFSLEYMDYAYDVEKFLSYPIILMEGSRPGLLTTTDAVTDIYCGVDIVYRIAGNKWFYAPSGKEFAGYWNTAADGTGTKRTVGQKIVGTSYSTNWQDAAADMHLYAQWVGTTPLVNQTKTVAYDANGGTGSISTNPQTVPAGTNYFTVAYNNNPGFAKEGHLFKNWNTKADGTGTAYNPGSTAAAVGPYTVLYAQWTPIKYTVKFAFDEIRVLPHNFFYSAEVSYGGSVAMSKEPQQKEAYVDYDINTNSSMSTAASAKWVTARPLAEKYIRSIQKFQGWDLYHYNTTVGKYVGGYYRFPEFEEVRQLCDKNGDIAYMFPAWGGIDAYVCIPEVSCPGYDFFGWMNDKTQEKATETVWYIPEEGGGLYLPKGNDTLYAWWEPKEYVINLVQTMNGQAPDVAGDATVTMTFDQVCPDVTAPQIERYVFVGYNTKPDGTGVWYYGEADRNTSIASAYNGKLWQIYDGSVTTLYAQWRPDKAIKYEPNYTWTAENALAGDVYSINSILGVEDNTVFVITEDPTFTLEPLYYTRRGYTFNIWNLKPDGSSTSFSNRAVIQTNSSWLTGIIPMYAQWTANGYKVSYDLIGNKPNASTPTKIQTAPATATYDTAFTVSNPAKRGYTFMGWDIYGMSNCTHYYGSNTTTVTALSGIMETTFKNLQHNTGATVSFTTQWQVNEYDVVLDDRGATSTGHTEQVPMVFDAYGPSIIVPTKTGYTFHGYFTGIRGAGTMYYDSIGVCTRQWTETDVTTLYAYWIQDPVELPDEGDRTPPEELPKTDAEGNIGCTEDGKALLYADDYNDATGALTDLQSYLTYDTPGSVGVIPGTELLSFRAKMGSWILNYKFQRYSGTDMVRIYVTVPYRTQYEIGATEELVISDPQTATFPVMIPKAWSYWEVVESGMYYPDSVKVTNEVLDGEEFTVEVDRDGSNAVVAPEYSAKNYGAKENHVFWAEKDSDGTPVLHITLTDEQYIISKVFDTLPDIRPHLNIICANAAWMDDRQASVKSDKYTFDGETILSDELVTTGNGAELDASKLPDSAEDIELTSYEQTYQSGIAINEFKPNSRYESSAMVTYIGDEDNIGTPATKEVPLEDINDLNIHTPIACDGAAVDGIEVEEEKNILTLKEALNFFTLRIDNYGTHRMSLGYGTKDFRYALSGKSNVAEKDGNLLNQVKFPFDVYVDVGSDSKIAKDSYDTTGDYYFKAGTWLTLGAESQQFYVPVTSKNGIYQVEFRSIAVNCPQDAAGQYLLSVETQPDSNRDANFYVATDILELEIKSYLKDFRITETNDMAAEEQRKDGCQALTLKKGYGFSYEVITQGEFYGDTVEIEVTPTYFWESPDGTIRQEVKVYRLDELLLEEVRECYAWETEPLLKNHENYDVIVQSFSGKRHMPEEILCVATEDVDAFEQYIKQQTITGKEDFFKQAGFLIIHFEIRARSNNGTWYKFQRWNETELAEDALAAGWNYIPGDVIRYDLSKSIKDDYEVGGVE